MADTENQQIIKAEERLKLAMLNSDINELDKLLADQLIFTNHLGQILTKSDDLEAHKSGLLNINSINLDEQKILLAPNTIVVFVKAHIVGSYANETSESDFRFTRVWIKSKTEDWQVIAAHSTKLT